MNMSKSEGLMPPVHPGEVLREDFMKPLGLTVNRLALELHVPATRIGEIVHERRRITAETALRLARYFSTNAEFWLNLQLTREIAARFHGADGRKSIKILEAVAAAKNKTDLGHQSPANRNCAILLLPLMQ